MFATALTTEQKKRGGGTARVSLAVEQNVAPYPEPASADETEEAGKAIATCTVVATLLLTRAPQKSCSQKGGCKKNCVSSQPPAYDRAPEGASLSALGSAANLAKCFLVFANGEARSAAAAAGAGCQVPRGNPGVRQVSGSALEKWPPSQMHVARSSEGSCVPPWWEDNDCAGFYGA